MKCLTCSTFIILFTGSLSNTLEDFSILLESKWQNLERNQEKNKAFGGKWILIGSIIFEKKSKEVISINEINLQWNGGNIENLIGSLYKKHPEKNFIPIQDNLVCDGIWNKTKQLLMLKFDNKLSLGPTTTFYLVLTIPEHIEPVLKKGSFCLEEYCLPDPFKHCAHKQQLSIAINEKANPEPLAH